MSASVLMFLASFLFATMGVCVKLASAHYAPGEIVFYRGLTGALLMLALSRWRAQLAAHRRSRRCTSGAALSGVVCARALVLCDRRPAARDRDDAELHVVGLDGAVPDRRRDRRSAASARVDGRLVGTVLLGFAGVALVLRPTIEHDQLWHGLMGLLSGMLAATAYLQVTALGRAGEPEYRIVFYFSLGGMAAGLLTLLLDRRCTPHTRPASALLLAVGVLATVAQLMMTRAYSTGRTLVNASLQYLGIACSFAYGVLLFDDPVTPMALGGMAADRRRRPVRDPAAQPHAGRRHRPQHRRPLNLTDDLSDLHHPDRRRRAAPRCSPAPTPPVLIDTRFDLADPAAGERAYARGASARLALPAPRPRPVGGPKTGRNGRHPLPERARLRRTRSARSASRRRRRSSPTTRRAASTPRALWWMLRWLGHAAVAVLDGGLPAWRRGGRRARPSRRAAPAAAAPYPERAVAGLRASTPTRCSPASAARALIDARAPERFRGEVEPLDRGRRPHPRRAEPLLQGQPATPTAASSRPRSCARNSAPLLGEARRARSCTNAARA